MLETTFRHITNGDVAELGVNEVINNETLERAEVLMQYLKGHKFLLLKVYNFVDVGLGIVFFNPILVQAEKEGVDSTGTVIFLITLQEKMLRP